MIYILIYKNFACKFIKIFQHHINIYKQTIYEFLIEEGYKPSIKEKIRYYSKNPEDLELRRKNLQEELTEVMKQEIIPAIDKLLSPDYSIYVPDSKVYFDGRLTSLIPTRVNLELRARCKGEPIVSEENSPKIQGLRDLKIKFNSEIKELAKNYGVFRIYIFGDSMKH